MDQQGQANKLFVGNVAYATQIQTLIDLFSEYGTITDSYKPEQKGYAFITFENADQAKAAMEALDGHEVDGRQLKISVAEPRQPREDRGFGGNNGGGFRNNNRQGGYNRDRGGNNRGGYGRDRY